MASTRGSVWPRNLGSSVSSHLGRATSDARSPIGYRTLGSSKCKPSGPAASPKGSLTVNHGTETGPREGSADIWEVPVFCCYCHQLSYSVEASSGVEYGVVLEIRRGYHFRCICLPDMLVERGNSAWCRMLWRECLPQPIRLLHRPKEGN